MIWLVLTIIFAATIACKPQGTHSEDKFGSKLVKGGTKGVDELTAVRKLVSKSNKTDDEWAELAGAVFKGGAKGDAVIKVFAERIGKNRLTIDALATQVGKADSAIALTAVRKKIANEFNELADNLTDNVRLMEEAFGDTLSIFAKRAELFAKLHPGGDSYQIALKAFNNLHHQPPFSKMLKMDEGIATNVGVRSDAYQLLANHPSVGLSGKTLVERQIKALFTPIEETSLLKYMGDEIRKMVPHQHIKGQEGFYEATSKENVANIKNFFSRGIKSIGGRKGLQECCGQHLVDTLSDGALTSSKTLKALKERPATTNTHFALMLDNIAEEMEDLHYLLQ